jgi:hypothetical protein
MRVRTEDGLILTGTAFEIIQQMRAMQWRVTETKGDYIAEVSRRVQDMTEIVPVEPIIRPNRATKLLRYLAHASLIVIEDAPNATAQ